MPISRLELIDDFGAAAGYGNAALFVGAGLSRSAHLPDWAELLEKPRRDSNVPPHPDLPLLAEYILADGRYSRLQLEQHILTTIQSVGASPTTSHTRLAQLPVDQVWTTNYDPLLEAACDPVQVITLDDDVRRVGATRRAVIKMHGSIDPGPPASWAKAPVITRSDYERYETSHPRMWALLRATYLSKTMLFLGFSFTDPNIEILQKLARLLGTAVGDRHMTVLRRPSATEPDELRLHHLRVRDLEFSGVRVLEIDDYSELDPLLAALVRRTRPARLFIAGSTPEPEDRFLDYCQHLARTLADRPSWQVISLGGPAGWHVSRELARVRRAEGNYEAEGIVFHFRKKDGPPPIMEERVGTAVYSDLDRLPLVQGLLAESRAVVVLGGGARTMEEIGWASELGAGVIPLASSGGSARAYWDAHRSNPPELGGQRTDPSVWSRLGNREPDVAARAAAILLDQAMYEERPPILTACSPRTHGQIPSATDTPPE